MPRIKILATALVAGMAMAGSASAAPIACPLFTDATGDSRTSISVFVPPPGSYWPHADIVSVDVASDSSWLTGVVRFVSLEQNPSLLTPGTNTVLSFNSSTGSMFELWAAQTTDGGSEFYAVTRHPDGLSTVLPVSGTIDTAAAEMRINVPLASVPGHVTRGDIFSGFHASAGAREGTKVGSQSVLHASHLSWDFAAAPATTTYEAGRRGCVTPGA